MPWHMVCSHVVVHAVIWQRASVLLFHAADVARYDVMKRLWGVMKSYMVVGEGIASFVL